jgi:hypothetical protein
MMKNILFLVYLFMGYFSFGQGTGWILKSDNEGIKLYAKSAKTDGTIQVRIISNTTASINAVLKASQDVSNLKERILNTQSVTILKQISPNDVYYRLCSDFPWPLSDRDAIMHSQISQNPATKVIKVDAYSTPSYMAEQKDYVRVYTWETHSILTPKSNGTVEIDYWFSYHPRGDVPIAAMESATQERAIIGMKKFIELTHLAKYQ